MKARCNNSNDKAYYLYGGKGVAICSQWSADFTIFKNWADKNGYALGLTIERLDSSGDYCPENYIWADRITQNNNTSRNRTMDGKTVAQHARDMNLSYSKAYYLLVIKGEK